jgi:hypothetical protein
MRFCFIRQPLIASSLILAFVLPSLSSSMAAGTVLYSVSDPQGDALGDGVYALPSTVTDASSLDLRTFTAIDNAQKLELQLSFGSLQNPERAPNGFSAPVIDVFINTERGGIEELGMTGFHSPPGRGWRYHLHVNGWNSYLETAQNAPQNARVSSKVKVQVDGANVVLGTQLPADAYRYWALVSLYDPLSKQGVQEVSSEASALRLSSNLQDPPSVLDILSPSSQVGFYASREVPALNEPKLELNPLLYSLFAGLALSLMATIWGLFRRP